MVIDERKGRQVAKKLLLTIVGTLQIILLAKINGIIPSVRDVLEELELNNFRFTLPLKQEILKLASEFK